jgi:hypothetical protein
MRSFACLAAVLLAVVQLVAAAENVTQPALPPNCGVSKGPRHPYSTSRAAPQLTDLDPAPMHRVNGRFVVELLNPRHGLYLLQCAA